MGGGWKWPWIMPNGGFAISDIQTSSSAVNEGEWGLWVGIIQDCIPYRILDLVVRNVEPSRYANATLLRHICSKQVPWSQKNSLC
jgi:hypothetical protein